MDKRNSLICIAVFINPTASKVGRDHVDFNSKMSHLIIIEHETSQMCHKNRTSIKCAIRIEYRHIQFLWHIQLHFQVLVYKVEMNHFHSGPFMCKTWKTLSLSSVNSNSSVGSYRNQFSAKNSFSTKSNCECNGLSLVVFVCPIAIQIILKINEP